MFAATWLYAKPPFAAYRLGTSVKHIFGDPSAVKYRI